MSDHEFAKSLVITRYQNTLSPLNLLTSSKFLDFIQDKFFNAIQWFTNVLFLDTIEGYYIIEEERTIDSPATQVMFTHNNATGKKYCIKRWLPCSNGLYETKDQVRRTQYTIDGWDFNCQFAPNVYVGVAPIQMFEKKVHLGKNAAQLHSFERDVEYALVMRRLDRTWQLDYQLHPKRYGTKKGMNFLAREIAYMHKRLKEIAPKEWGSAASIEKKWRVKNRPQFLECLDKLSSFGEDTKGYEFINEIMNKASTYYATAFEQRFKEKRIKRCHGDLKATNLWICPENFRSFSENIPKSLFALDCVDFEPQFYYIDTLSDVAMLAVDIEVTVARYILEQNALQQTHQLSQIFLKSYLSEVGEMTKGSTNIGALLEYYMTEKALVYAYMNILYDENSKLGKQYLAVAVRYAKLLRQRMEKAEETRKIGKTRKRCYQQDRLLHRKNSKQRSNLSRIRRVNKRNLAQSYLSSPSFFSCSVHSIPTSTNRSEEVDSYCAIEQEKRTVLQAPFQREEKEVGDLAGAR